MNAVHLVVPAGIRDPRVETAGEPPRGGGQLLPRADDRSPEPIRADLARRGHEIEMPCLDTIGRYLLYKAFINESPPLSALALADGAVEVLSRKKNIRILRADSPRRARCG